MISKAGKIFAAWIPVAGIAMAGTSVFETAPGFVSATQARDVSRTGAHLLLSNCTAEANGVMVFSGATNCLSVPTAISSLFNPISMTLTGAPAVSVGFWLKVSAVNNSDKYNNILLMTRVEAQPVSGQWINLTSNRVLFGCRSLPSDSFQELISASAALSNTWTHISCVQDIAGDFQYIYINGVLSTSAAATFAASVFSPSPNTSAASYGDGVGNDTYVRTRGFNGRLAGMIVEPRLWRAADVRDVMRRTGKGMVNP